MNDIQKEVMAMLLHDKINAIVRHLEYYSDTINTIDEKRIRPLVERELQGLKDMHDFVIDYIKSRLLLKGYGLNTYENKEEV